MSNNISNRTLESLTSGTEADAQLLVLDTEEASLIQELEKAKAKLVQIQEKKRKALEDKEKATPLSTPKGVERAKGIEYEHVNTILLSAKDFFDTDNFLDLNEAWNTDWKTDTEDELSDEDIGIGDPNINVDIDLFDLEPSSRGTDHDTSGFDLSFTSEEKGEGGNQQERLGQNEWRMEPPPERTYRSLKEAKEAALKRGTRF